MRKEQQKNIQHLKDKLARQVAQLNAEILDSNSSANLVEHYTKLVNSTEAALKMCQNAY